MIEIKCKLYIVQYFIYTLEFQDVYFSYLIRYDFYLLKKEFENQVFIIFVYLKIFQQEFAFYFFFGFMKLENVESNKNTK